MKIQADRWQHTREEWAHATSSTCAKSLLCATIHASLHLRLSNRRQKKKKGQKSEFEAEIGESGPVRGKDVLLMTVLGLRIMLHDTSRDMLGVGLRKDSYKPPLYMASASGKLEILQLLVERGADVHSRNKDDWTPLKTASHQGHLDVVRFLIDSSADVNSRDNQGRTPLHAAASKGHLDVLKLLLARGADFSIRDDRDRTPFDLASNNGNPEVADFLFGHMASSMSLDGAGNTISSTISLRNRPLNLVHRPRKRGEDVTPSDSEGRSVYTASKDGQLDIVRSLLDSGSAVNERNTRRETALGAA